MELWLVRHAQTQWSTAGRHTGRTDVPLTEEGRARATALAPVLGARDWATVLCSPLARAVQTADLAGLGAQKRLTPDLLEYDYGEYEGVTTAEIRETQPTWYLWRDGCPGGEAPQDVAQRVDHVIDEVLAQEGDVCCVAHGHVLRALAARWLDQPVDLAGRLALSTGATCVLGFEREVRVVWRWNETRG